MPSGVGAGPSGDGAGPSGDHAEASRLISTVSAHSLKIIRPDHVVLTTAQVSKITKFYKKIGFTVKRFGVRSYVIVSDVSLFKY